MSLPKHRFYAPGAPYVQACPEIGRNSLGAVTMSKPVVHYFFLHAAAEFLLRGRGARCDILDVGSGLSWLITCKFGFLIG